MLATEMSPIITIIRIVSKPLGTAVMASLNAWSFSLNYDLYQD